MSAIYEEPDSAMEPVKVLITLFEGMDAMDVTGPLEVFHWAQHDKKKPGWSPFLQQDMYDQSIDLTGTCRVQGLPRPDRSRRSESRHSPGPRFRRRHDLR